MPIPWPAEILPEVAALGLATALAGSLIGAFMGARLGADEVSQVPGLRWAGLGGAAAATAMIAFGLYTPAVATGVTGKVTLTEVNSGPQRTAIVNVRLMPADAAKDATWLLASSWQGGGLVVNRLQEVRPGVYRSTEAMPIHGDWKSMVRLHTGNQLSGLPIYAPADNAIPAPLVPAPRAFVRPFISDHILLQREAKTNDPLWAWGAYGIIGFCTFVLLGMLSYGLHRVRVTAGSAASESPSQSRPSTAFAAPPAV